MGLLGAKLRELRGSLSLYEVSKATGIPSADIGRYESENYHPTPRTLKKLAEFYEVPYKELRILYYEDEFSDHQERAIIFEWANARDYVAEEMALIECFRKHPPNERQKLLKHIHLLLKRDE
jgi:transcriptional regulator with XRE-family HTH domain